MPTRRSYAQTITQGTIPPKHRPLSNGTLDRMYLLAYSGLTSNINIYTIVYLHQISSAVKSILSSNHSTRACASLICGTPITLAMIPLGSSTVRFVLLHITLTHFASLSSRVGPPRSEHHPPRCLIRVLLVAFLPPVGSPLHLPEIRRWAWKIQ